MKCREDMLRVEMSSVLYLLVNGTTGETVQVMPAQQVFMKVPAAVLRRVTDTLGRGAELPAAGALKATGRTETINEWRCAEYAVSSTNGGTGMRLWLSTDVPRYGEALEQWSKAGALLGRHVAQMKGVENVREYPGFPVRTVMEWGGTTNEATVVEVSLEELGAAEFMVPAAYRPLAMPNLESLLPSHRPK
jgi:hypothetical protein